MLQLLLFSAVGVSAILNFVGLIVTLFIAVVNYKMWVESHRNSSSGRILFSMGITRLLLLGLFLPYIFCFIISPNIGRSVYISRLFLLCWMFLDSNNLWFVTLLNVLYCVKIINFQHPVFVLLKRNLFPKLPRLLLACVLVSAVTTLLHVLVQMLFSPEFTPGTNGTAFDIHERLLPLVSSLILISFLQFVINVTFASLLINSLRRHIQNMRRNTSGFWNPQTEAHVGVMKLMMYSLLLYIPYSISTQLYYNPTMEIGVGISALCMITSNFYLSGHSVLIVLTHPKLKTKAKKVLCCNKTWNISSTNK